MSSASVNNVMAVAVQPRLFMLAFNTNAALDPATTNIPFGSGFATVTHIATGRYNIRFSAGVWAFGARVICRGAFLSSATATPNRAHTGGAATNSDGTLDISVFTVDAAGAAVDVAAGSNNIVSVIFGIDEAGLV